MTRLEIEDTVIRLAAEAFDLPAENLSMGTSMEETRAWDSFAHVALVSGAEETFGLELPPQESAYFETLSQVADALEKHMAG